MRQTAFSSSEAFVGNRDIRDKKLKKAKKKDPAKLVSIPQEKPAPLSLPPLVVKKKHKEDWSEE